MMPKGIVHVLMYHGLPRVAPVSELWCQSMYTVSA